MLSSRDRVPVVSHWGFFSVATDGNVCSGVDSASKNEYQGIPLGVKAAGAWGWRPTTLVVPNVKKIRGFNLPGTPLGPCGLLWAWPDLGPPSFLYKGKRVFCSGSKAGRLPLTPSSAHFENGWSCNSSPPGSFQKQFFLYLRPCERIFRELYSLSSLFRLEGMYKNFRRE
jgi:hypothetical protein